MFVVTYIIYELYNPAAVIMPYACVGQPQDGVMLPLTAITITIAYLAALGAARKVKFIFMLNGNGDGVDDDDMCANVNTQQTDTHTVTNVLSSGVRTHTHTRTHTGGERNQLCFGAMRRGAALARLLAAPVRALENSALFFSSHNRTSHHRQRNSTRSRPPGRQSAKQRISQPSQGSPSQFRPTTVYKFSLALWLFIPCFVV